jgi:hypothetical protein
VRRSPWPCSRAGCDVIRNHDWYNLNSVRSYPLDDRATRTGDKGERLLNGILLDLNLRFPRELGEYAYLSSLVVTKTLLSATFLACPDVAASPETFVPLAAVTVARPLQAYRHYALNPLHPGVGGWAVFGDIVETFQAKFSTPQQGLILPRCARPYRTLPVKSAKKLGVSSELTGIVNLQGAGDIEVTSGIRRIDGVNRKVIVLRLNSFSNNRNVFDIYKGPCGARPESENCNKPGVEFINTVGPDCSGNIQLVFTGDTEVTPYIGSSEGLVLDHPLGLTEACTRDDRLPNKDGRLPNEYDDTCTSAYEGYIPDDTNTDGGDPPPTYGKPSVSSEIMPCPELPYVERFNDQDAESWRPVIGLFGFVPGDSPQEPEFDEGMTLINYWVNRTYYITVAPGSSIAAVSSVSSQSLQSLPEEENWSYQSQSTTGRNVSFWDTCAYANTLAKRLRTDVRLQASGPKANGGLLLNYHTLPAPYEHDEYMVAEIDHGTDSLRLRLWGGTGFTTEGQIAGLGLKIGDWYRIEAEVTESPDDVSHTRIKVSLTGITDPLITASFTADTTRYLPADGKFGLATDQAVTAFSYYSLEELDA